MGFSYLIKNKYIPSKLILLLTSKCNLSCSYCFYKTKKNIIPDVNIKLAEKSIDWIISNLNLLNRKTLKISYHGGGEPFLAFDNMKKITQYAKKKAGNNNKKLKIDVSTNGNLNRKKLNWILKNVNRLKISFDGTEIIQNKNRPNNKKNSYHEVLKSFKYLETKNYFFTIRLTIKSDEIYLLEDIVSHVFQITKYAVIKIELVTDSRENYNIDLWRKFISVYKKVKKNACAKNRKIISFDANDTDRGYLQCGAWGDNAIVDGYGNIFTCFKRTLDFNKNSNPFYMGKVCAEKIKIYEDNFKNILIFFEKKCNKCLAVDTCGAWCLSERYKMLEIQKKNYRCGFFKNEYR